MCKPKAIVRVGKLASKWIDKMVDVEDAISFGQHMVDIIHPAAIKRMNIAQQGLAAQDAVIALREGLEECLF